MANNFRRYQPRRSSRSSRWIRVVIVLLVLASLVFAARAIMGGRRDRGDDQTNEPSITLVNDAANVNSAVVTNTNSASNTNTTTAEPEISTVPDGVCTEPIAKYGDGKVAVLTFELSAANDNAKNLLEQLKKNSIPASFFSTGTFAEKNPGFVKSVVDAGFYVYSRGYDSTNLTTLDAATLTAQLAKAATAIEAATGSAPTPYLRPAFSATNATVVTAATEAGYCIILGTVDATDWQDGVTPAAAVERVMGRVTPGMIIQLHAGYDVTGEIVADLVTALRAKGYSLMTLPSLINS